MKTEREKRGFLSRPIIKILLVAVIAVGLLISISDIRKIFTVVQKIELFPLAYAFIAAILSYLFIGLALQRLLRIVGERLPFRDTLTISWISTTLNYLISTGGIGGLTMRIFLLRRKNVSFSDTFVVSFVQALLLNGVLIGFVLFGFGYLLTSGGLHLYQYITSGVILALSSTLAVLAAWSVFVKSFRDWFIDFFYRLINRFSLKLRKKKAVDTVDLHEFKEDFNRGISLMVKHKKRIVVPALYIFLDWFCCLLTLHFSFVTIGYRISPGVLVVGFAIGIFVSLISFVPGAIGIMEGSMAAIYYSLNVPLEIAIVAVIVYRCVLYVFPFVTSTFLYYPLLKEARAMKPGGFLENR